MPLHWNNIDTRNAILSAAVPVSAALVGSLYVNKNQNIVTFLKSQQFPQRLAPSCQYLYMVLNVGAAAPLGYASYLVYKIGGGFDYTDTTVALGLYATTLATGIFGVPAMRSKNVKTVFYLFYAPAPMTVNSVALAILAAATTVAFYKIDKISGYWTLPFSLLTLYYAAISTNVAGCCGGKPSTKTAIE